MDAREAQDKCICKMCPTFSDCGEPLAYCLYKSGVSACILSEQGCICPGCPVQSQLGFTKDYYCVRGSAQIQSK